MIMIKKWKHYLQFFLSMVKLSATISVHSYLIKQLKPRLKMQDQSLILCETEILKYKKMSAISEPFFKYLFKSAVG